MAAKPLDVVVIGNAGVDTNVFFRTPDIDFAVEANFTENLDHVGQAGAYAARTYASLGWRVGFIGHVGDDWAGRMVREAFARDGIDTTLLGTDPSGTARSINFMYPDGRRKNFYDAKGQGLGPPEAAKVRRLLRGVRLVHCNLADWSRHLLPLVRELGIPLACDLQDLVTLEDPYRQDFIRAADILFFSSVNHPNPAPLIRKLLKAPHRQAVLSGLGARGCAVGTRAGLQTHPAVSLDAPVVDTNGAGDSLAAGFLAHHVLAGRPLGESIRAGLIAARHTCAQRATSDRQITADQLRAALAREAP